MEEPDSLKSRDILIISRRTSISSLCLVWADAMAVTTAEVTALEIKCYIVGSIAGSDMSEMGSWNWDTAFE